MRKITQIRSICFSQSVNPGTRAGEIGTSLWGGKRLHIQVVGGEQPADFSSFLPLASWD